MSTYDKDWLDFTHSTRTSEISAQDLFERYREFQSFISGLSRKELVARRWLKNVEDDSPLVTVFFDLPLSKQPTLFRKSAKADDKLLSIWQARARAQARSNAGRRPARSELEGPLRFRKRRPERMRMLQWSSE